MFFVLVFSIDLNTDIGVEFDQLVDPSQRLNEQVLRAPPVIARQIKNGGKTKKPMTESPRYKNPIMA